MLGINNNVDNIINKPPYQWFWLDSMNMDANVVLRNLSSLWTNVKIWSISIWASLWDTTFTWIGFLPKVVLLLCAVNANANASWGISDWTNNYCLWQWPAGWMTNFTTSCINIQDWWLPSTFIWTVSSMNSDWFVVNINTVAWVQTLRGWYAAIW